MALHVPLWVFFIMSRCSDDEELHGLLLQLPLAQQRPLGLPKGVADGCVLAKQDVVELVREEQHGVVGDRVVLSDANHVLDPCSPEDGRHVFGVARGHEHELDLVQLPTLALIGYAFLEPLLFSTISCVDLRANLRQLLPVQVEGGTVLILLEHERVLRAMA